MAGGVSAVRSRVAVLVTVALLVVSGCAALVFGASGNEGEGYAGSGPSKLRIAIYEPQQSFLVPHAALVIHSPDEHLIYDPAGWTPDERGHRLADVTYSVTPEVEQAFLMRETMPMVRLALQTAAQPESWELFLFDLEVSDETAREAARLARARPALPITGCAFGLSTLLRQLSEFEDIPPCWFPSRLREALQGRDDLTLTRHLVPPVQGG